MFFIASYVYTPAFGRGSSKFWVVTQCRFWIVAVCVGELNEVRHKVGAGSPVGLCFFPSFFKETSMVRSLSFPGTWCVTAVAFCRFCFPFVALVDRIISGGVLYVRDE